MAVQKEEYWSRFADTFDEDQTYIVGQAVQQAVISRLSEERDLGEVVEFGCGRGFFTKAIAGNANRILATDLSDEMVAAAKEELKEFKNGYYSAFPGSGGWGCVFWGFHPQKTHPRHHRAE
jgi:predicted TPR repeat methyltransferase